MSLRPELGSGPLTAGGITVVGRDYGVVEAAKQQPFQGPAGTVLDKALRAAGVSRDSVRVDNLVPKQPPGNDWAAHTPADVVWGQQRLDSLLRQQKPKLIVGLGGEVAQFLLGDSYPVGEGIQDIRGFLWDTRYGRVLTTVHPAGCLRDWTPWRALLDVDLRRATAEWRAACPPLVVRTVTTCTSLSDVEELDDAIRSAAGAAGAQTVGTADADVDRGRYTVRDVTANTGKSVAGRAGGFATLPVQVLSSSQNTNSWLAVDIENHADLSLACVGFAPSIDRAWVIPAGEGWQLAAIRRLCESATPKVLQNGQYDRAFLRWNSGITLAHQVFDTQLGWHALQPELAGKKTSTKRKVSQRRTVKSLNFLASIYTRDPFWKNYAFQTDDERYTLCGRDCCVTLDIALKQVRQLGE